MSKPRISGTTFIVTVAEQQALNQLNTSVPIKTRQSRTFREAKVALVRASREATLGHLLEIINNHLKE